MCVYQYNLYNMIPQHDAQGLLHFDNFSTFSMILLLQKLRSILQRGIIQLHNLHSFYTNCPQNNSIFPMHEKSPTNKHTQ